MSTTGSKSSVSQACGQKVQELKKHQNQPWLHLSYSHLVTHALTVFVWVSFGYPGFLSQFKDVHVR